MFLPTLTDSLQPRVAYTLASVIVSAIVFSRLFRNNKLDAIPTAGSSSWLGSWWDGYQFEKRSHQIIREGYEKYKSTPFKFADRYHWLVAIGGHQHIEDLREAHDDTLSFYDATNEMLQHKYTMGKTLTPDQFHVTCVRSHLTRNLVAIYPEMHDEISVALDEVLDLQGNDWKSVPALSTIQKVICRTSNRVFVGLPLCRDPDWIDLNIQFTLNVVKASTTIRSFPSFLAPIVGYFASCFPGNLKRGVKHLSPVIEERMNLLKKHGNDWPNRPNDLLSWFLDEAPEGPERTVEVLTSRMLVINFGAIHTSSNSLVHALFFLVQNPQYIQALREEVDAIVTKEGWSKASLEKMHKVDSFLKETQRLVGVTSLSMTRIARKEFTFSDGTVIPKGTRLVIPSEALQVDEEHYENAHAFNPFRFADIRDENENGVGTKHQFVSTTPQYLPFGYGKHACPGRFFAANELKSMLAFIVTAYDIKLKENTTAPEKVRFGLNIGADPTAEIMIRRRVE